MTTSETVGIMLLAFSMTGCSIIQGLFGSGSPKAAEGSEGSSDGQALSSTQSIALGDEFPTPLFLGALRSKGTVSMSKHGVDRCVGYLSAAPVVTLDLEGPIEGAEITVPGAESLLIEFEDGKYFCDTPTTTNGVPTIKGAELPAGKVEIFVGSFHEGRTVDYDLYLDETTRPITLPWRETVEPVVLTEKIAAPIIRTMKTAEGDGKEHRCSHRDLAYGRTEPAFVFELKRPVTDLRIGVRSSMAVDLGIFGPIPPDGRNSPVTCSGRSLRRLEPGLYAVHVVPRQREEAVLHHLVVTSKSTPRKPKTLPAEFLDDVPLEGRIVEWHFPELVNDDLFDQSGGEVDNDDIRAWLVENAPRVLFVFPKYDLDKSIAELFRERLAEHWHVDSPPVEFPKANEPLLLIRDDEGRAVVMAVDGSLFKMSLEDLLPEPTGAIVLPASARNPHMTFSRALNGRGPEDERAYRAYDKKAKANGRCHHMIDSKAERRIAAIRERPPSRQNDAIIDRIDREAEEQILRKCKPDVMERQSSAIWLEMMKSRTARRDAHLKRIRPKLEALFE